MKTTITPQADAVRPLKPELDAQPSNRACEPCPNCGAKWFDDQLREIRDIFERVDAGEPMPAGECPECGALCHLAEPARRVLIEVTGGCAEVTTCPPGVEVEIVDHDNAKRA